MEKKNYMAPSCEAICVCPEGRMMQVLVTSNNQQNDYNYHDFWGGRG